MMTAALAFGQQSKFLSYDWALFELKGKVAKVTWNHENGYTETLKFSQSGRLTNEKEEHGMAGYYKRDSKGRIIETFNGHAGWTWSGKQVTFSYICTMSTNKECTYSYDSKGNKTGYKDMNGDFVTYKYNKFDSHGNWTSRTSSEGDTETRKIIYY